MDSQLHCAICLEDLVDKQRAKVKNCFHQFCVPCIKNWSEKKTRCPICQVDYTVIVIIGVDKSQKEETIQTKNVTLQDEADNLDYLDHTFFYDEIVNLLNFIKDVEFHLKKESAKGCLKKTNLDELSTIKDHLEDLKRKNVNKETFEPALLINEIYEMQERIDYIKKNSVVDDARASSFNHGGNDYYNDHTYARGGNDSYGGDDDDYYDDYDYDEEDEDEELEAYALQYGKKGRMSKKSFKGTQKKSVKA
mmetsp:Transcript_47653/g.54878  ORF Transcript_47653/g.54878 Transcript_47653/m.54878 type:complete len:250 (-) Transcript_47653:1766-2515(-)